MSEPRPRPGWIVRLEERLTRVSRRMEEGHTQAVEAKMQRQAERQARVAERTQGLREIRDSRARTQGYADYDEKRKITTLARKGYRYCPMCKMDVRPQAPWGFTRIVTLSLLTPGKHECPRCKGTDFLPPGAR